MSTESRAAKAPASATAHGDARALRFSVSAGASDVARLAASVRRSAHHPPTKTEAGQDAWVLDRAARSESPGALRAADAGGKRTPAQPAERSEHRLPTPPELPGQLGGPGDALELVSRAQSTTSLERVQAPLEEIEELLALGDFTGALAAAELVLGGDPTNERARSYAQRCRKQLNRMYASKLGSLAAVPEVTVQGSDVRWLGLDPRAGFLLSRIDGRATVEDLLDVCPMDRTEALKTLVELLHSGAISLR